MLHIVDTGMPNLPIVGRIVSDMPPEQGVSIDWGRGGRWGSVTHYARRDELPHTVDPMGRRTCLACSWGLPPKARFCPNCGVKILRHPPIDEVAKDCQMASRLRHLHEPLNPQVFVWDEAAEDPSRGK